MGGRRLAGTFKPCASFLRLYTAHSESLPFCVAASPRIIWILLIIGLGLVSVPSLPCSKTSQYPMSCRYRKFARLSRKLGVCEVPI